MHQASILFTFAVMAMAGTWYAMQDTARREAEPAAVEQVAALTQPSAHLAE